MLNTSKHQFQIFPFPASFLSARPTYKGLPFTTFDHFDAECKERGFFIAQKMTRKALRCISVTAFVASSGVSKHTKPKPGARFHDICTIKNDFTVGLQTSSNICFKPCSLSLHLCTCRLDPSQLLPRLPATIKTSKRGDLFYLNAKGCLPERLKQFPP